jgi:hypothetical protein
MEVSGIDGEDERAIEDAAVEPIREHEFHASARVRSP